MRRLSHLIKRKNIFWRMKTDYDQLIYWYCLNFLKKEENTIYFVQVIQNIELILVKNSDIDEKLVLRYYNNTRRHHNQLSSKYNQ